MRPLIAAAALFLLVAKALAGGGSSTEADVCKLLKKEKWPAAYLLDDKGQINGGPLDFGRFAYTQQEADLIYIPTAYRVVIGPKRIQVLGVMGPSSLELTEVKSVCRDARTYQVRYAIRGFPAIEPAKLPWKENNQYVNFPELSDPKDDAFSARDLTLRFEDRMVGEIYDASKETGGK